MKFKHFLFSIPLLLTSNSIANAELHSASNSEVSVLIKASVIGSFHASTKDLSVEEKDGIVIVKVPLQNLTTENSLRDKHMKEDLGIDACPVAVLTVPRKNLNKANGTTQGDLLLNGQTHPMSFTYTTEGVDTIKVSADSILNMKNWGVPTRTYLGVGVKETVIIKINFTTKD